MKPSFSATLNKVYVHFERHHGVLKLLPAILSHLTLDLLEASMQISVKLHHDAQADHFGHMQLTEQAVYLLRSPISTVVPTQH